MFINNRKKIGEAFKKQLPMIFQSCIMPFTFMEGVEGVRRGSFDRRPKGIKGREYEGMDKASKPWNKYVSKRRGNHNLTLELVKHIVYPS